MSTVNNTSIEDILQRLRFAKKFDTWKEVCAYLGVGEGTLSAWRTRNTESAREKILYRCREDINDEYLLTGYGPMVVADNESPSQSGNEVAVTKKENDTTRENVPLRDAIDMTEEVLLSDTIYRGALWENIKALHRAIQGEEEREGLRKEVGEIKKMLSLLIAKTEGPN